MYLFRSFMRLAFARWLRRGPVPTLVRLFTSKHLGDYQFLFCCLVITLGIIGWYTLFWSDASGPEAFAPTTAPSNNSVPLWIGGILASSATFISWIYQSASKRIGTVDLFACEISSLCRVCLVTDFAKQSLARFAGFPPQDKWKPSAIDVKESYTPVYDSGTTELQSLESRPVSAITAFYTYRKTMMDYLRASATSEASETAKQLYEQVIYMQFLMYESGRLAVQELTEFEPEKTQNLITIYCSELPLFTFLLRRYRNNDAMKFLYRRLHLRIADYRGSVQRLLDKLDEIGRMSPEDRQHLDEVWLKALTTADELDRRYRDFKREVEALEREPSHPSSPSNPPDTRQLLAA
jgi:hypothetical protein